MENLIEKITESAVRIEKDLIAVRRHLHRYPEKGRNEYNTTNYIYERLKEWNIDCKKGNNSLGVTGDIKVNGKKKTYALRADIDALPVKDAKKVEYRSENDGLMHACGHDFHTSVVLGTAKILKELRNSLSVNARFIFQHCEEAQPSGAQDLINEGVLKDVTGILGFHAEPGLPAGKAALRAGQVTAGIASFSIGFKGKSGHSALPHLAVDPVFAGAQFITDLYSVFPRRSNPLTPFTVSICSFHSGKSRNVIADNAVLEGTLRMLDFSQRNDYRKLFEDILKGVSLKTGITYELDYRETNPPVINEKALTTKVMEVCKNVFGEDNVEKGEVRLGAEDFSLYSSLVPGCYMRIGTGGEERFNYSLHTDMFDINEKAIVPAVNLFSRFFLTTSE